MDAYAALDRGLDRARDRPVLAPDVELARFYSRRSGGHAVLHQPRTGSYYRLTGPHADLVAALDGSRTVAQLTDGHDGPGVAGTVSLVEFLRSHACLTQPPTDAHQALSDRLIPRRPLHPLRRAAAALRAATVHVSGVPALTDAVYRHGGRWLFTPAATVVLALLAVAGPVLLIAAAPHFDLLAQPSAASAATLWGLALLAIVVHELGHALAIRHAGRRILGAGFGLYFGNPVFFINSSDMLLAPPRARAINAVAGPLADFVLAGAAVVVANVVGPTPVGAVCYRFAGLTFLLAAVNLFPLLELDGYWLLTDLLDVPDLRPRALAFLRRDLPWRLRTGPRLTRGEWGLTLFAVGGVAATAVAIMLAAIFWWPILSAVVAGLWESGWLGRSTIVLLAVVSTGPLVAAMIGVLPRVRRAAAAHRHAVLFRLQRSWRVEATEQVAALPQWAEPTAAELGDLGGRFVRRRVTAGEVLLRQGVPSTSFFLVRRGHFVVLRSDAAGHAVAIASLGPGDTFGDHTLRDGGIESDSVHAKTDGEVFLVDADTYRRLLAHRLLPSPVPADWPLTRVHALLSPRGLDSAATAELARLGSWTDVPPGRHIPPADDPDDVVRIVASGQVEVVLPGDPLRVLRAGDELDIRGPTSQTPPTVRALTPVRLFTLPAGATDLLPRSCGHHPAMYTAASTGRPR